MKKKQNSNIKNRKSISEINNFSNQYAGQGFDTPASSALVFEWIAVCEF